jgi:hypothetical protein
VHYNSTEIRLRGFDFVRTLTLPIILLEVTTGAGNRVRTDDLLITNQLLYQLSYAGFVRWR